MGGEGAENSVGKAQGSFAESGIVNSRKVSFEGITIYNSTTTNNTTTNKNNDDESK